LRTLKNVILTPHIGGSTEEAQSAIGVEVGNALTKYVNEGTTLGAVNMPEVSLRGLGVDEVGKARVSLLPDRTEDIAAKLLYRLFSFTRMFRGCSAK
jgi:D-3-phosphoglycerate dehydrogenase